MWIIFGVLINYIEKKIIYKLLLSIYELVKLEKTDIIVVLHQTMISIKFGAI